MRRPSRQSHIGPARPMRASIDWIRDVLLQHDHGAYAGDEQRRVRVSAEFPQHRDVAHLVNVDRRGDPDGQRPTVDGPVHRDEPEHRRNRRELAQTK